MKTDPNDNENGVSSTEPTPVPAPRHPINKPVLIGIIVLVVVAVASIVHHWHMVH